MTISAIVLAAGTSSRMPGRNKLLLPLGGKTVIAHTVDNLLGLPAAEVIVVLGFAAEQVRAALPGREVKFARNADYALGMSSSIIAGLHAIADQAQAVMIALGDMPMISVAQLACLCRARERNPGATIVVPVFQGRRGHPVIFDVCHKPELLALRGDAGGKALLARYSHRLVEVEMGSDQILRDVDTPAAYHDRQNEISRP